jgi:class 3 adenylate cyclase
MHREFKSLLATAEGDPEWVIAVFLDIRGFSAFSQSKESPQTAIYIRRVYERMLDDYFSSASFYKPTGDGLMVILPFTPATLKKVSANAIRACLKCIAAFPKLCNGDPMITFPVPQYLGIGVSRGPACKLFSGEKTLDYSGHFLNLAARLMNLARPSGLIVDSEFTLEMIPLPERKRFRPVNVWLRGIAEGKNDSRTVFVLDTVTRIPKENSSPFDQPTWRTISMKKKLDDIKMMPPFYRMPFPSAPADIESITVEMIFPRYHQGKHISDQESVYKLDVGEEFVYQVMAGNKCLVRLNTRKLIEVLRRNEVKDSDSVSISATYAEKTS